MDDHPRSLVTGLRNDVLYQLSTAGQELFHSNLLYWLLRDHPVESSPLATALGMAHRGTPGAVRRERRHVDLIVERADGSDALLLENKLHALPNRQQLIGYTAAAPMQAVPPQLVLLSLVEPTFAMPDGWRRLGYDDLVEPLAAVAAMITDPFSRALVEHYGQLVSRLVALVEAFDVTANPAATPAVLDPTDRDLLAEARLLPLVEKLRMTGLSQLVSTRLGRPDEDFKPGLANTQGQAQYYRKVASSAHEVGWQYQGGQVRLVVLVKARGGGDTTLPRPRREQLVVQRFPEYCRVESLDHPALGPVKARLDWLGYEPSFVYRYRPLSPGATMSDLAQICADLTARADDYAAAH